MTEEDNFIDVDKEKEYSEKNLRFRIGGKGERGIKEKMKKKGNKEMKKSVTTISRNPRKPAELCTHTFKSCLENFNVKFNRTIQNAMYFESLFFYKGVVQ